MVSVATAKVKGRRRSWTGAEGCPLDPFDATDEPSGCSPSQAAIRRTMIDFTSSESSRIHMHVVSTHRRPSRAKRAACEKNPCWRRSTWMRATCGRRPLCMTVMDGVPDKKLVVVDHHISYEKASQVFEEKLKELDKHSAVRSCQAGGCGEG